MLQRCQRGAGRAPAVNSNISHVADVEQAYAAAHGLMFGNQPAARWILDRHFPAAEIHHLRAQRSVYGVQGRLTKSGRRQIDQEFLRSVSRISTRFRPPKLLVLVPEAMAKHI